MLLILCLPFLVALEGSGAHARLLESLKDEAQVGRQNTWSARSSTGRTLAGTWTAVADPKTGTVTGTWTVIDANRKTLMRGGWSAAKSPSGWTGAWRAAPSGSKTEYSGTWSASVDLKPDAPLADLFETAVQKVVSGNWRAGAQSGAWSIRAFD
jgi:hypothetical protein